MSWVVWRHRVSVHASEQTIGHMVGYIPEMLGISHDYAPHRSPRVLTLMEAISGLEGVIQSIRSGVKEAVKGRISALLVLSI